MSDIPEHKIESDALKQLNEMLRTVSAPPDATQEASSEILEGDKKYKEELNNLHLLQIEQKIKSGDQDIAERKKYADNIFLLICVWLIAVGLLLILCAYENQFSLSDNVLMALIGGTTANVLGIFVIVANYLFPKR